MIDPHHLFVAAPASGLLAAQLARSLSAGHAQLADAGYGVAVLGPHRGGQVHLDGQLLGTPACGLFHFFANARQRAEKFATTLGAPIGRLVIQTLAYDAYYPKLWRDLAETRPLKPFAGAVAQLAARPRGWVEVIADLRAALDPEEIVVLPAPALIDEALAALVPGADVAAQHLPSPVTRTDSQIAMLQRLMRGKVSLPPQQMKRLARFHSRQPQGTPIAEFDPMTASALRKRYAADLDRIAAMSGVRIGAAPLHALAAE